MSRTAIPVLTTSDQAINAQAEAVKANIDRMSGQGKNTPALKPLLATASNAEIIARLNVIVERLQG